MKRILLICGLIVLFFVETGVADVCFDMIDGGSYGSGIYSIEKKEVTDWTTVSRTVPERNFSPNAGLNITPAIYHVDICNQVGQKYEVTYAVIDWKGERKEVELERQPIGEQLERAKPCYQGLVRLESIGR